MKGMVQISLAVAAQLFLVVGVAQAGRLIAVPEPTTMGLLGAAAAVGAVGAWWRHRK